MSDDPAKARFFVLQALRWSGMILALLGVLVIYGKVDLPREAGYVLFVAGLIDALIMPTILARRWKTPR